MKSQPQNFNPRSHERSDSISTPKETVTKFQSTLPREERHVQSSIIINVKRFQSTLPREERREVSMELRGIDVISIHAPTRGATLNRTMRNETRGISIHAPTRGATHLQGIFLSLLEFQSTLPREERPFFPMLQFLGNPYFNPRSHERSD